jgi:Zn-finger nucleic acid-binding protein
VCGPNVRAVRLALSRSKDLSDEKRVGDDPLPQDAFRNVPFTDEDAYFAEQEKINLELLKKERESAFEDQRTCLRPSCEGREMERVAVDNVEIDKCPVCGGMWLDPGELDLLIRRAKGSTNGLMRFFKNLAGHYDDE